MPGHPENKERMDWIYKVCLTEPLMPGVVAMAGRPLSRDELALVHETAYIDWLDGLSPQRNISIDGDTYFGATSFRAAIWSAGCAVRGVEAIMSAESKRAFALCRPPGHHAFADRASGFCFFNNTALAARFAQSNFGIKRVAIVDWDVHHGNGTQAVFYDDPEVLFVSLHQYPAYPGTGAAGERGRGLGLGYTLNIPLPAGSGEGDYLKAIREKVVPRLHDFRPELIIVSAGQDALASDPLADMKLYPKSYAFMAAELCTVAEEHADGRILFCLEGGYHLEQQAQAVGAIIAALLPKGPVSTSSTAPSRDK